MFRPAGIQQLSNRELLALLVGKSAANRLHTGLLTTLFNEDVESCKHKRKLHAAREIVKRLLEESLAERPVLASANAIRDFLRLHFLGQEYESFVVLFLDSRNCLIAVEDLFRGTLDQTAVFPREVVKRALHWNAAASIFAHNHPNGSLSPTDMDRHLTNVLKSALQTVGVRVLDHLVVGSGGCASFSELGYLEPDSYSSDWGICSG